MDFEFTPEQLEFVREVEEFLDANDDPEVFDVTRENMAQIVDTPLRRKFMAKVGEQGWLGITWPEEYGGKNGEGIYEYLLNEALAARGGPQIGKGVGIIGKTIISRGSEQLKQEFLPKILRNEVGTVGSSTARRPGPRRPISPTGTGWAPAPIPRPPSTTGSPSSSCP
jgi:3-oxocholest-4-en-26-oyl-CoA dehydrogenase alpha subunit